MRPIDRYSRHYLPLMRALAQHQGKILNYCDLARVASVSRERVRLSVAELQDQGLLRLIPALPAPNAHDTMRSPRVYLRPRAWSIAYSQGDLSDQQDCPVPLQSLFAARMSEEIIAAERRLHPQSQLACMGRYFSRSLDLVIQRGSMRLGYILEPDAYCSEGLKAHRTMRAALAAGWIDRGFLVHLNGLPQLWPGPYLCLSADQLLKGFHAYTRVCSVEVLRKLIPWQNNLPWVTRAAPDPVLEPDCFQLFRDIRPP